MKSFGSSELRGGLGEVGVSRGDIVMVHASLIPLGIYENAAGQAALPRVVSDLQEVLGSSGTLVVPTFTYAFCRGLGFDRQNSPGEKMGVFSEYVRQMPEAIRSSHPIQSVTGVGARSQEICSPDCTDAFAEQGPFGIMLRANAKLCSLGYLLAPLPCFITPKNGSRFRTASGRTSPAHISTTAYRASAPTVCMLETWNAIPY